MYRICKELEIAASHCLDLPYESKCNRPHGHTYRVVVEVEAAGLNELGMVVDFTLIKKLIDSALDHEDLNELFKIERPDMRTTSENIAEWIFTTLTGAINDPVSYGLDKAMGNRHARVVMVRVWESSSSYAEVTAG